jgi:hypothetical protein
MGFTIDENKQVMGNLFQQLTCNFNAIQAC